MDSSCVMIPSSIRCTTAAHIPIISMLYLLPSELRKRSFPRAGLIRATGSFHLQVLPRLPPVHARMHHQPSPSKILEGRAALRLWSCDHATLGCTKRIFPALYPGREIGAMLAASLCHTRHNALETASLVAHGERQAGGWHATGTGTYVNACSTWMLCKKYRKKR